jgi:hypothetical protein
MQANAGKNQFLGKILTCSITINLSICLSVVHFVGADMYF